MLDASGEFDRQVELLVRLGYPALAGRREARFRSLLEPLREPALACARGLGEPTPGRVPFLLVVARRLVPPSDRFPLVALAGRPGFVSPDTADLDRFEPVADVRLPDGDAYAVVDVDRGDDTRGMTPDEAVARFASSGRSPLTVEEGIALATCFPSSLERNHCFQLAGSRCGDRRVPGIWISDRRPKLGFCWAGNRHAWLGIASCASRAGGG